MIHLIKGFNPNTKGCPDLGPGWYSIRMAPISVRFQSLVSVIAINVSIKINVLNLCIILGSTSKPMLALLESLIA